MRGFGKLSICVILLFIIALGSVPVLAAPIVSIQPPFSNPNLGQSFDVAVSISSVTDLFAFNFEVSFDPGIVSAEGVTEGTFLLSGGSTIFLPGDIDNTVGSIALTGDFLIGALSGVSGSGTLALLTFEALAPGNSPITLSNVSLLNSSLEDISAEIQNGSASVTGMVVPEPATVSLFLMGMGMFGVEVVRKRGNRKV